MWFKNLRIYRLDTRFGVSAQTLAEMLDKHSFTPGSSQEPLSLGWVAPREGGELVHEVNGQYLICLRAEKELLPSAVVNQAAREKAREIEENLERQVRFAHESLDFLSLAAHLDR